MTVTLPDRSTLRTDLKTELQSLITSLQSTDHFYKYEPASYGSISPVVFLRSAGTEPTEINKTLDDTSFFVELNIMVLYGDLVGKVYYEEAASNLLDAVENQVRVAVKTKRVVANKWQKLSIEGRSTVTPEPVGGELYLHEVITLRARMY